MLLIPGRATPKEKTTAVMITMMAVLGYTPRYEIINNPLAKRGTAK
jgi:hypothetical protein